MRISTLLPLLLFFFILAAPARAAIGPERQMAAFDPILRAAGSDGVDFLIAFDTMSYGSGLILHRISADGDLVGVPLRITDRLARSVQIISGGGSTAVVWSECVDRQPYCNLNVAWIADDGNSVTGSAVVEDQIRHFAAAASPRGNGSVSVAWVRGPERQVLVSELPRHASSFARTEAVASEPYTVISGVFLASNRNEMLVGWVQMFGVNYIPQPSYDFRVKVRPLDADGRPAGPVLAMQYEYPASFEADGENGFIVAGRRYGRQETVTTIRSGAIEHVQLVRLGRIVRIGETLFAAHSRPAPGGDPLDSYLTVVRNGSEATFTLTSDRASYERGMLAATGGDRLLVVYRTEDPTTARGRIGYRIVDPSPFPTLPEPPAPPRVTAVTGSDPATAYLHWDAVEGARAYRVTAWVVDEPGVRIERVFGPEERNASVELPVPEAKYAFELIVDTEVGLTPPSVQTFVQTGVGARPRSPFNVSAAVSGGQTVTLRWTDASSNESEFQIVHGYDALRIATLPANTTEATFEIQGRHVYALRVIAVNASGRSYSPDVIVEVEPRRGPRRRAAGH